MVLGVETIPSKRLPEINTYQSQSIVRLALHHKFYQLVIWCKIAAAAVLWPSDPQ